MIYLLDTNVCIRLLNNSNQAVIKRIEMEEPEDIVISTITQLELYYGVFRSNQKEKNLQLLQRFLHQFITIPLDEESAKIAGKIKADLANIGKPIGPYDVEIAAIALANNLILVTHNTKEFSRVNGLKMEDWEIET